MVDMVEARKRAKAKQQQESAENNPPNIASVPAVRDKIPVVSDRVPAPVIPEERTDFLQRLLQDEGIVLEAEEATEVVPEEVMEVLVFQLGKERYGIDIHQVAEIIRYAEPTEVPHTVSFLDG